MSKEKNPTEYFKAPEVEEVSKKLIKLGAVHERLRGIRIDYYFRSDTPVSNGQYVVACSRLKKALDSVMCNHKGEPFFVITVSKPSWDILGEEEQIAVVDHELCHCGVGEFGKLYIDPHDLQEFSGVVRRHGAYCEDIQKFLEAAHESTLPTLFEDDEEESKEAA